jgi:uncharacterized protein (DUF2147 family)
MKNLNCILFVVVISFLSTNIFAQKEVGVWKTIDDETGNAESYVEISMNDNKLYGKIIKILDESQKDTKCTNCEGAYKDKPFLDMQIINGLKKRKSDWYLDGGLFYPKFGKTFDCKLWLENDNTLKVRGYWGLVYRTQTWHRVK